MSTDPRPRGELPPRSHRRNPNRKPGGGCLRTIAIPAIALATITALTACPKSGDCKTGQQDTYTVEQPTKVKHAHKLCRAVATCKDGRWREYINPNSCHIVKD